MQKIRDKRKKDAGGIFLGEPQKDRGSTPSGAAATPPTITSPPANTGSTNIPATTDTQVATTSAAGASPSPGVSSTVATAIDKVSGIAKGSAIDKEEVQGSKTSNVTVSEISETSTT